MMARPARGQTVRMARAAAGYVPSAGVNLRIERDERQAAEAARFRAAEASERAAALQSELDERARSDRKLTHDASLAQAG